MNNKDLNLHPHFPLAFHQDPRELQHNSIKTGKSVFNSLHKVLVLEMVVPVPSAPQTKMEWKDSYLIQDKKTKWPKKKKRPNFRKPTPAPQISAAEVRSMEYLTERVFCLFV